MDPGSEDYAWGFLAGERAMRERITVAIGAAFRDEEAEPRRATANLCRIIADSTATEGFALVQAAQKGRA